MRRNFYLAFLGGLISLSVYAQQSIEGTFVGPCSVAGFDKISVNSHHPVLTFDKGRFSTTQLYFRDAGCHLADLINLPDTFSAAYQIGIEVPRVTYPRAKSFKITFDLGTNKEFTTCFMIDTFADGQEVLFFGKNFGEKIPDDEVCQIGTLQAFVRRS